MGLDIYKYKATKDTSNDSEKYILDPTETNKSMINLFNKFSDYVIEEDIDFYDWMQSFIKKGLNEEDYDFHGTDFETYEFKHKQNGAIIEIPYNEIVLQKIKTKVIYCQEVAYQRKGVTLDFYDKFYGNCWYITNKSEVSEDDQQLFVFNNEVLNEAKKYAEPDAPIQRWCLADDEFVYFSA